MSEIPYMMANTPEEFDRVRSLAWPSPMRQCPRGPHRGPQGPNEDLAQCPECWSVSHAMRPEGEEFGGHLPDCSLPQRHESYCAPGGDGHPAPTVVRGYWPEEAS